MNENENTLNNDFHHSKDSSHIFKYLINGLHRILIIWFLSKERLHGYGLMKKLDEFFQSSINKGHMSKFSSSKVYPILDKMEKDGIVIGEWELHNNKQTKFYELTSKGKSFLTHMKSKRDHSFRNPLFREFYCDFMGVKSNDRDDFFKMLIKYTSIDEEVIK